MTLLSNISSCIFTACFMLSLAIFPSCNDNIDSSIDKENSIVKTKTEKPEPLPGNDGILIINKITSDYLTINWTIASDDTTPQQGLQYTIYQSFANNINTHENAQLFGTSVLDWTENIDNFVIQGLAKSTIYYFNVFVKDRDNNISAYQTVSATTASIDFPPLPGDKGVLNMEDSDGTLKLQWNNSIDHENNITELAYSVFTSDNVNNLYSYDHAIENSVQIIQWTRNISEVIIEKLFFRGHNYFNVFVKDIHNNITAYTIVDYTNFFPEPGNAGSINTTTRGNNIRLEWNIACDAETISERLRYRVIRGKRSDILNYESAIRTGKPVTGWKYNIDFTIDKNLDSGQLYYYNVFVKDKENNISAYRGTAVRID